MRGSLPWRGSCRVDIFILVHMILSMYLSTYNSRFSIVNWWSPDTETRFMLKLIALCMQKVYEEGYAGHQHQQQHDRWRCGAARARAQRQRGNWDGIGRYLELRRGVLFNSILAERCCTHTTHDTIIVTDRKFEMSVFVMLLVSGWRLKCLSVGVRVSQFWHQSSIHSQIVSTWEGL